MRPLFGLVLIVLILPMIGCNQRSSNDVPPVAKAAPADISAPVDQVAAAKAHVQQYIDRLVGGDVSIKMGLLGGDGANFDTVEHVEMTSAVPTYLKDGKKVPNMVRVIIKVRGYDGIKKRMIEQNIDRDVHFLDGKWGIVGAGF